jgi:predicted ATPase with chaperone activity
LTAFIRHVTSNITEAFVSHKDGPMKGFNTDTMYQFSKEEFELITREDSKSMKERKKVEEDIKGLESAKKTVEAAARKMRNLEMV